MHSTTVRPVPVFPVVWIWPWDTTHWFTISKWQLLPGSKNVPFETTLSDANVARLADHDNFEVDVTSNQKAMPPCPEGPPVKRGKTSWNRCGPKVPKIGEQLFFACFFDTWKKAPKLYSTTTRSRIQQNDSKFCFGAHQLLKTDRSWHCSQCIQYWVLIILCPNTYSIVSWKALLKGI